jgi:hypothetical protein
MAKADLTAQRVRELLDYNPESGILTWRVNRSNRPMGSQAGTINKHGHMCVGIDGSIRYAHRLIWLWVYGEWPDGEVDHINGIRADNRIANLRCGDRRLNMENKRRAMRNSKSGVLGVTLAGGRWRASIGVGGRTLHLGTFDTPEMAHERYLLAKRRLHEGCTI